MALGDRVVIQYDADISRAKRQIQVLDLTNKTLAKTLGTEFAKGASVVSNELKKITYNAKGIKLGDGTVANQLRTYETVLKGVDGKYKTLTRTVAGYGKNQQVVNQTVKNGANVTRSFGDNLKTLLKRAVLTIPVWFALRQGIATVFRTIKDGLATIAEFDRAMQKLNRNLSATSPGYDFSGLQDQIEEFSIKSGRSVTEVTNAIQKFATVGFTLEESLAGGIGSLKLAVNLFGEGEETAKAFARSLRVLTNNLGSTEEKQLAIKNALALTDKLWQTNAFEITELNQDLEKFAGTANIANLSINDTLAVLATLSTGGQAKRAGRLLRTTLLSALADIQGISQQLQLSFDPSTQGTTEFILALVDRLSELKTVDEVPADLAESLGELFGARRTEIIASLVSLKNVLRENLALRPDLEAFDETFNKQTETISGLTDRYKNLNKLIGKAFTEGLVGGDKYINLLRKVVGAQEDVERSAEAMGYTIKNALIAGGIIGVGAFRAQLLAFATATVPSIAKKIVTGLATPLGAIGVGIFTALQVKEQANKLEKDAKATHKTFDKIGQDMAGAINKGLKGNLSIEEIEAVLAKIDVAGTGANLGLGEGVNIERVRAELEKILAKQKEVDKAQKQSEINDKKKEDNFIRQGKLQDVIIKNTLDRLKLEGASTSEILKAEQALNKRYKKEKDIFEVLDDQLKKEQAINDEKELGTDLSDRAKKLYDIAQKYGVDMAKGLSDVLAGDVDFSAFVKKGGKALDVFKENFGDIFKEQQALSFFKGKTQFGFQELKGGQKINVPVSDRGVVGRTDIGQTVAQQELQARKNLRLEEARRRMDSALSSGKTMAVLAQEAQAKKYGTPIPQTGTVAKSEHHVTMDLVIDGKNFSIGSTSKEDFKKAVSEIEPRIVYIFNEQLDKMWDRVANNPKEKGAKVIDNKIEDK